MFGQLRLRVAVALLFVSGLGGCTLFYPRFDSLLNPDIAIPNAGEVVDSVKCAITTFYIERASRIKAQAVETLHQELEDNRGRNIVNPKLCPKDWKKSERWHIGLRTKKGAKCETSEILEGPPTQDHVERTDGCRDRRYELFRYVRLEKEKDKYRCVPNGGCTPGTTLDKGKCVLKDESRFALDPTGKAKIELSLAAVNTGSMNYQKIDATGFLPYIIVPGDQAKGFPFPGLKLTDKKTNKVELTLTMPQAGSVDEEQPDKEVEERLEKFKELVDQAGPAALTYKSLGPRRVERRLGELTQKERDELIAAAGDYKQCGVLKINFLGLSDYINNIVSDQESNVHKGGLEVGLDSLTLTSQFQIAFDATAGTQHLLRIVPVLQPPMLGLNPDHTHSLKLTFAGRKGRAFAGNAKSLMERCKDRFKGIYESLPKEKQAAQEKKVAQLCSNPQTVLIESLIEAVESIKTSGSSN